MVSDFIGFVEASLQIGVWMMVSGLFLVLAALNLWIFPGSPKGESGAGSGSSGEVASHPAPYDYGDSGEFTGIVSHGPIGSKLEMSTTYWIDGKPVTRQEWNRYVEKQRL